MSGDSFEIGHVKSNIGAQITTLSPDSVYYAKHRCQLTKTMMSKRVEYK